MLESSLERLRCPNCSAPPALRARLRSPAGDVHTGELVCGACGHSYPILAGVAVLVPDPASYVIEHVKGISRLVPDAEIPAEWRDDYLAARAELEAEHIEEDLEAERVVALYLMNHFLRADGDPNGRWWEPAAGAASPMIASLVREHWDRGPLARIGAWLDELAPAGALAATLELGCGVGSLSRRVEAHGGSYLGIDSSFASVALARHLALGAPYPLAPRIPADLLEGPVSREIRLPAAGAPTGRVEFVVGDFESPPVVEGAFTAALALNAIDMLPDPAVLPAVQAAALAPGGVAIQCGPYIWHEVVARELRERLPAGVRDSAGAVSALYEAAGLSIERELDHVPWLFFKQARQVELYSVHLLQARKRG